MLEVNYSNYNTYSTDCLTQWDTNQELKISGLNLTVAPTILFSNRVSVTTDPVISTLKDGVVTCDIPNGLLTKSYPITAYVRTTVDGATTTICKIKIPIIPSTKPEDYVFIENISIISYETLVSKINSKVDTSVFEAKVSTLENTIDQILKNGTTQDQINNSVENWITQAIDDGTIAAMTIGDESVTPEKTTFFDMVSESVDKNSYNASTTNWGYYTKDGTTLLTTGTSYGVTDFVEIVPNIQITVNYIQCTLCNKVFYYDADKQYIGNIDLSNTNGNKIFTITDDNAKYIKFTAKADDTSSVIQTFTVKRATTLKEEYIPESLGLKENSVTPEMTTFFETVVSNDGDKNFYDADAVEWGYYTKDGTTLLTTGTSYGLSDYIPVIHNRDIKINCIQQGLSGNIFGYSDTSLDSFIEVVAIGIYTGVTFQVANENVKYIRFNANLNTNSVIINTTGVEVLKISKDYIQNLDFNITKWAGKKVIVDGDSITSNGEWHTFLAKWFKWDVVYNHGCSGNTLTKARAANDASGVGNGLKGYERVQQNYEEDADAILLMGDLNDFSDLGTYTDTTEDTWCGRMNLMLDALIEKYPLKPIVLISNPPRSGENRNGLGNYGDSQAKAMKELAENRNFYYIDCYHNNMFRPDNETNKTELSNNSDGVHLNTLASKLEAQFIFEELKKVGIDFE